MRSAVGVSVLRGEDVKSNTKSRKNQGNLGKNGKQSA